MTVHLVIDSALGDLLLAGEESGSTGGGCVPAPVSTTGRAHPVSVQPGRERAPAAFDGSRKKSESAYRPGCGAPGTGVVHALRTTGVPLIDVRFFTTGRFGASVYGAMFLLPLSFQQAGGHSAWDAGLLPAPQGIGTVLVLPVVGRLAAGLGPRTVVLAGMAVSALGTFACTQADPGKDTTLLVISLLIRGVGLGTTPAPVPAADFAAVAPVNTGRAAALIASIQLGGSAGTALRVVVAQQQLTERLGNDGASASTATSPDLAAPLTAAFETAFWWTLGICALGAVAALFLPGPERGAEAEAEA